MYKFVFDHILLKFDAEHVHNLFLKLLNFFSKMPCGKVILKKYFAVDNKFISNKFISNNPNLQFFNGIGLAAGFDASAKSVIGLSYLGFSYIEIGTVTLLPEKTYKNKLYRHKEISALRKNVQFTNIGVDSVIKNLIKIRQNIDGKNLYIGANIGLNSTAKFEYYKNDYIKLTKKLLPFINYLVVNTFYPNKSNKYSMHNTQTLKPILKEIKKIANNIPVFIKISPDLAIDNIIEIANLINELNITGVISISSSSAHNLGPGVISGKPLFERALEIIKLLKENLNSDKIIIGTGGIMDSYTAKLMLNTGANSLQVFTGLVYKGPKFVKELLNGIKNIK